MGFKDQISKKLGRATSDKVELNRQVLRWRGYFLEVNKILDQQNKKKAHKEK